MIHTGAPVGAVPFYGAVRIELDEPLIELAVVPRAHIAIARGGHRTDDRSTIRGRCDGFAPIDLAATKYALPDLIAVRIQCDRPDIDRVVR